MKIFKLSKSIFTLLSILTVAFIAGCSTTYSQSIDCGYTCSAEWSAPQELDVDELFEAALAIGVSRSPYSWEANPKTRTATIKTRSNGGGLMNMTITATQKDSKKTVNVFVDCSTCIALGGVMPTESTVVSFMRSLTQRLNAKKDARQFKVFVTSRNYRNLNRPYREKVYE